MSRKKSIQSQLIEYLFSPAKWPHREVVSRITAFAIIGAFLALRMIQFDQFPQTWSATTDYYLAIKMQSGPVYSNSAIAAIWITKLAVWLIETGVFLGYLASYLTRAKAISIADGFMETAFPVVVAGIPILISLTPYTLHHWAPSTSAHHIYVYLSIMGLMVLGGLINLIGLLTMRRAFTIMTEARTLVTGGIFHYVRHPLYSGHFIMFFASLLMRFHYYTVFMYIIFVVSQVVRARLEEGKLENAFPEYAVYKSRTGMFLPKFKI